MRAAVVVIAACSAGPDIEAPRGRPALRLVECAPAQPLFVEVDGRVMTHGQLDGGGLEWATGGRPQAKRAASVSLGIPVTSGMMDAMVIRKVVTTRLTDLTRCYERELATIPAASRQQVMWRFAVTPDGRVMSANPTTNVLTPATSSCVTATFRQLAFPSRTSGGFVTITLPLTFDAIPVGERAPAFESEKKVAWTPFAIGAFAPDRAMAVARATESAMRDRTGKLDACYGAASGSLRAVLGIEADGTVAVARAGGLGDPKIEACVEKDLVGAKVVNPLGDPTEITCDFARGDAQPWRVSTAGYAVIAATRKALTFGKNTLALGAIEPEPLPGGATYLIVADGDAPGSILSTALAWAAEGDATLVAMRDVTRAPLYLGMGRAGHDDAVATRPILRLVGRNGVHACLGKQMRAGKLADAGTLALRLAKRCRQMRCGSLVVGLDDFALVKDLVEVTGAARRAGFDRVLIAGQVDCEQAEELEDEEP